MKRNEMFNVNGCVFRCIDTVGMRGEKVVVAEGQNAEVRMFLESRIGPIYENVAPVSCTVAVTTKKRGRHHTSMIKE